MKVNFDFKIAELDGRSQANEKAGVFLGQALGRAMVNDETKIYKFLDWGRKISTGQILDLDKADQETLKKFIVDDKTMPVIVKGQLLEAFDNKEKEAKDGTDKNKSGR